MADQKITQLTELAATPDDADILAIVDDVAGTPITKKITVENLLSGAGGGVGLKSGIVTFPWSWNTGNYATSVGTLSSTVHYMLLSSASSNALFYHALIPNFNVGNLAFNSGKKIIWEISAVLKRISDGRINLGITTDTSSFTTRASSYALIARCQFTVDTNGDLYAVVCNGSSVTRDLISSSFPVDPGYFRNFKIEYDPDNTQVLFYIDGVLESTITTNLPTASSISPKAGGGFSNSAASIKFYPPIFGVELA